MVKKNNSLIDSDSGESYFKIFFSHFFCKLHICEAVFWFYFVSLLKNVILSCFNMIPVLCH